MLLAYSPYVTNERGYAELCIIPDKPDSLSVPYPVNKFFVTNAGILRLGPEEALLVESVTSSEVVFKALNPSKLFLTLDLPLKPGFHVNQVKVQITERGYKSFYKREKPEWQEWVAYTAKF